MIFSSIFNKLCQQYNFFQTITTTIIINNKQQQKSNNNCKTTTMSQHLNKITLISSLEIITNDH